MVAPISHIINYKNPSLDNNYYQQDKPRLKEANLFAPLDAKVFFSSENVISVTDYPLSVKLSDVFIANLPIQLQALRDEINTSKYMLQFEDNWDGEGSEPYNAKTWIDAVSFICNYANWVFDCYKQIIPIPNIYHAPKGSIDLYWEKETFNLLINFPKESNGVASFYGDDYATQRIEGHFNPLKFQNLLLPSLIQF